MRLSVDPVLGVELAAASFMSVNLWGSSRADWETNLRVALAEGGLPRVWLMVALMVNVPRNGIPCER